MVVQALLAAGTNECLNDNVPLIWWLNNWRCGHTIALRRLLHVISYIYVI